MTDAQMIKIAMARVGCETKSELAKRVGWSDQNLANKMRRNNFSTKELNEIATALGCEYQRDMVPIGEKEIN